MTEIPFEFFKKHTHFDLPNESEYAVGLLFSNQKVLDIQHKIVFNQYSNDEELRVIGYRDVPVDTRALAEHAASTMPYVQQIFVDLDQHETSAKQLCLARKQTEQHTEREHSELHFTSLSHKTVVYKGWLRLDQTKTLCLDLNNKDYQSKLGLVYSRFNTSTLPSWKRAHSNRLLIHNGEINTVRGNVN